MEGTTRKNTPWTVAEVETLLSVVAEDRIQKELDGATRNEKVYKEIARTLAESGYHRTFQQCREKFKKLKSDYRQIKDKNGRSGSNHVSWKWYEQMDQIYGRRPAMNVRERGLDSDRQLLESIIDGKCFCVVCLKATLHITYPIDSTSISDEDGSCTTDEAPPAALDSVPTLPPPSPAAGTSSRGQGVTPGKKRKRSPSKDLASILIKMNKNDVKEQELNRAQQEEHLKLILENSEKNRELEAVLRREEAEQTAAFNQSFLGVLGSLVEVMRDRRV
ncbi:Zinc finger protein with KRAB and SCAN domains 2 [Merluccius polli]|uniref:Zinc finger protein with KRAB and SCAN domains 2 n=1 Tax=Merluccius polli TaxID=89951 RepID=A0AA47P5A2_MERPO|nr:Zinc finger protein with KRAB and SCAN domains 2 [Merluccius polli]